MTIIPFISDVLLVIATLTLAVFCLRLSKQIGSPNEATSEPNEDILMLKAEVDALRSELEKTGDENSGSRAALIEATDRADDSIGQLEMLIAAAEDIASTQTIEADVPDFVEFRARRNGRGNAQQ